MKILFTLSLLAVVSAHGALDEFGNTLYQTQHGAPAGYPGVFAGTKEAKDKVTGMTNTVPLYPQWGFPELENYPGSVEHYRHRMQKYEPALNPFNTKTLVRNFIVGKDEEYAEPIYYVPMYSNPIFTGKHQAPVKVLRLKKDGSNSITLDLGKLQRGMYAVRLVGALPCEPNDWNGTPTPMVLTCRVNDRTWTRRVRPVDEFYCVGAWYFHATDNRPHQVELRLEPESQSDLLVYNVDLHNPLAECPEKVIKRSATVYTTESRQAAQAHYQKTGKTLANWGANIATPTQPGLWKGQPLAGEERAKRDAILWNLCPPDTMNLQNDRAYGKYDQFYPPESDRWELAFKTKNSQNWDRPRVLENKTLGLTYTAEDYLNRKPLPGAYPDRGWGVNVAGKGYYSPLLEFARSDAAYQVTGHSLVGALPVEYFNRNNLHAARDAALLLCRLAYTLPADTMQQKNALQQVTCRSDQVFTFNDPLNRRYTGTYGDRNLNNLARAYDILFDFIKDNQELAAAVGRFVPWIRTPADVRAFLDQRILQFAMQELTQYRMGSSHDTSDMTILIATIAQDAKATRPLMDYLFSRTWDYPLPLSGLQDYMVTGTTRDGTTTIGSYSYTSEGSPFLQVADAIRTYIQNGGDPKYNLADRQRYPKPFEAAYFNLEVRVAGLWVPGVGDVGGTMPYDRWFAAHEPAVRTGFKYFRDPKLAYILKNYFGRTDESDKDWAEIETAAAKQTRNPWMENRSRVLPAWAGILEAGTHHDDFRFRRAATVRVGLGWGHSHRDTLDLQLFGLGCQMSPDGGQRPGYGHPDCTATMNHNVVEVDGTGSKGNGDWEGHAWVRQLADLPGSHFLHAAAIPPGNKSQVRQAGRSVALIDVDEGKPGKLPDGVLGPKTVYDKNVTLPKAYVFDVSRVAGGKRHTYGFHGCPEDEFTVNAVNPTRELPERDAGYLRKYVLEGCQGAGDAPDTVVATWRLGREPFNFTTKGGRLDEGKEKEFKCAAPEPTMLGANYDPASPRKFTRLHLLGQQGARCLWGKWISASDGGTIGQWFTQLHVMHEGDTDRESAFPAIIEMYAGEPAIAETTLLTNNVVVAVKVKTTNGHTDILVDDARSGQPRQIGNLTVNARFAYVSTDATGLRQASIAQGTELDVPGTVRIHPRQAGYQGTVTGVNHLERFLDLSTNVPARLVANSSWDIGNARHRTSVDVTGATGNRLHYRKGLELVCTRVMGVEATTGIVTGKLVSILMGADEDNGMKPGMTAGLQASNEGMTKWWQCEYLGGSRDEGYRYKLTGAPVTAKDFPANSALRIWEIGVGDQAELATYAGIRRSPVYPDLYEVTANVPFTLALPAAGIEVSHDRSNWSAIKSTTENGLTRMDFTEEILGTGRLFLRVRNP